jgi:putative acetyltransferase
VEHGCIIRSEESRDHDAIAAVVAAAFGSRREADLVDAIRSSPEYIPELTLVAEAGNDVVGHVMVSYTALDDGDSLHQIFQLAPLAVDPARQRQGIGSSLVTDVIAAAKAFGAPFVVLQGDPRYYSRFGFEPAARHGITLDLPDWASPEAAQIIVLRDYDPVPRGRVVYPPAFDEVTDS